MPSRNTISPFQRQLACRLGVDLPENGSSSDAARVLDLAISKKVKEVLEKNGALRIGKVITYKGGAMKIVRKVETFKFVLQPPSGGKQQFVWIIDLEDCEEASVEG